MNVSGEKAVTEYWFMDIENLETDPFRVTLSIPKWVIQVIDKEAKRLGVSRTSIINMWLVEHIDLCAQKRVLPQDTEE